MTASLTYEPLTNTVTVTDTSVVDDGLLHYFRLTEQQSGELAVLTSVMQGTGATWQPGSDGAYKLVLQEVAPQPGGGYVVVTSSSVLPFLQVADSLLREQEHYVRESGSCHVQLHKTLCERYRRQQATALFLAGNLLTADRKLRTSLTC